MGAASGLQNYFFDTPRGRVVMTAEDRWPDVLMIHGFKRSANRLLPWRRLIPGVGFLHLPGHGGTPLLDDTTVEAWSEALGVATAALEHPPLLIGESLGAVVALTLPARAVVAVEPLMSVHQLWPLERTMEGARRYGVSIEPEDRAMFLRPFDWILERITAPSLVIAGAMPLLPERPVRPEPSLLTNEDLALYAAQPRVEGAFRIPGGHVLLDHNREGVMAACSPFMARHPGLRR